MSGLNQVISVTAMNLRSMPQRLAASVVAIIGIAAVVGVFAGVLSMASGFEKTMQAAGSDSTAIILRSGSNAEMNSGIGNEQAQVVADAPGVMRDEDFVNVCSQRTERILAFARGTPAAHHNAVNPFTSAVAAMLASISTSESHYARPSCD